MAWRSPDCANRTIFQLLRSYCTNLEANWVEHLDALEIPYNASSHSSTGLSPFEVDAGRSFTLPMNFVSDAAVPDNLRYAERIQIAKDRLAPAAERQKTNNDEFRNHLKFAIGEPVPLKTHRLKHNTQAKLQPPYCGPFTSSRQLSSDVYEINLPTGWGIFNKFHVSSVVLVVLVLCVPMFLLWLLRLPARKKERQTAWGRNFGG